MIHGLPLDEVSMLALATWNNKEFLNAELDPFSTTWCAHRIALQGCRGIELLKSRALLVGPKQRDFWFSSNRMGGLAQIGSELRFMSAEVRMVGTVLEAVAVCCSRGRFLG